MSKRTIRWRLRDHIFSRIMCRKKFVVKFYNRKKTDWHGVGQLSTNGVKLYSVTSHRFVLGRTRVYMYGGSMEKDGDWTW